MSLETNWWLLWKELARAWEKKSGLLSIQSESWQYAILVGFRSGKQPCLEIYSVHAKCIEVPWKFKDSIDIQYQKCKIQFVFNIRFNNQLLFTYSPFMHNAITRLNWWSGWGKLHVSQVLKFTQVWSSISAREHWVKQRKGEHWTSRGICKNWDEIKNEYIMIFKKLFIKSVVYPWSSGCKRELRANKESVLTITSFPSPPNIQSTHPVHHH